MKTEKKSQLHDEFTKPKHIFSPKVTVDDKLPSLSEERQNMFDRLEKDNSDDNNNIIWDFEKVEPSYCDITTGKIINEKRSRKQVKQYHADNVTKIPNIPDPTLDAPRSHNEALKSPHSKERKKAADTEINGFYQYM
jgi:hypothetical protein